MDAKDFTRRPMQPDQMRQLLIEMTAKIDAATTVDDLKPVLPMLLSAQMDALPPADYLGV